MKCLFMILFAMKSIQKEEVLKGNTQMITSLSVEESKSLIMIKIMWRNDNVHDFNCYKIYTKGGSSQGEHSDDYEPKCRGK